MKFPHCVYLFCRHVRILAEPDPASSSAASWPTAIQTALHLYVDGNAAGVEETTPGKYSERLVLSVAFLIVSGAVIGSYFLSTYIGIVLSILICICIFLIVAIPYCCRFCTSYGRYVRNALCSRNFQNMELRLDFVEN